MLESTPDRGSKPVKETAPAESRKSETKAQVTGAEGGLENESRDLQAQADNARLPEEGSDILERDATVEKSHN